MSYQSAAWLDAAGTDFPPGAVESVTLRRHAVGARDADGYWVPGAVAESELFVVTEPVFKTDTARRQRIGEGGKRVSASRVFWLANGVTPLLVAEDGSARDADEIEWDGHEWTVVRALAWGSHIKVFARRRDDPPSDHEAGEGLMLTELMRWARAAFGSTDYAAAALPLIPGNSPGPAPGGPYASALPLRQRITGIRCMRSAAIPPAAR